MPVPVPEGEAHALRQCLTILGRQATPSERQTMASNTNRRISGADTSTLTFSLRQVSLLFYPANDAEARRLENLMRRARDANKLTCSLPIERGGITFSDLAVWPDCPPVPQDSPLRYWLPSRPEKSLGTGCEEIGERRPIEPPLAVASLSGTEAPLPLGTQEDLLRMLGGKQLEKAFPHHVAETQGLMLKPDHKLIADDFLRLEHDGREFSTEEARTLLWTPRPADEPALPFPFDARQLAAFMVFGAGQEIAHIWPDDDAAHKLEGRSIESPTAAFRLLHEAHQLLAEAESRFPFPNEGFTWQTINDRARWLLAASVEIQARIAGTLVPAPAGIVNLQQLVLTREGLNAFAARLAIQVVDMPHFVTSARPLEVPAALLALPDDARVSYEHNSAGERGSGVANAAEYRESIRDTVARQAEGHFTLNEAAQVLADSRPGLDPRETVKRFRLAHSKGELPIHQGESRFPLEVGETVRDFWDTVEVRELDAWLRASVGYGFPAPPIGSNAYLEKHSAPTDQIAATGKIGGSFVALPEEPIAKRARLLEMFRERGGKRPSEGGKKGIWGALTRVVEGTGIDKDTLGAMLDKAIVEKRQADAFAQLQPAAKR